MIGSHQVTKWTWQQSLKANHRSPGLTVLVLTCQKWQDDHIGSVCLGPWSSLQVSKKIILRLIQHILVVIAAVGVNEGIGLLRWVVLMVAFHNSASLFSKREGRKLPDLYWNSTNPMWVRSSPILHDFFTSSFQNSLFIRFRLDNTDHIIDVNMGTAPHQPDTLTIICPSSTSSTTSSSTFSYSSFPNTSAGTNYLAAATASIEKHIVYNVNRWLNKPSCLKEVYLNICKWNWQRWLAPEYDNMIFW